jgi:cellulose synthase/poly-beta-1,6-N-acetylglucosamine synthase-like glycosyltransferase
MKSLFSDYKFLNKFKFKNNLNSLITFFSIILFTTIFLLITSNFSPIINNNNLNPLEKGISIILLLSFIYSGLHCVGYLDHLIKSLTLYNNNLLLKLKPKINTKSPPVSILIPTLNEDPEMVRNTILKAKNVNYNNFKVSLIDSSTDKDIRNKTAIMCNELDINYIYRDTLRGYKAGSINDALEELRDDYQYILILDSDHRLKSSIFQDLIPIMENDPDLTFIQTPQYFHKQSNDHLSIAYSFQQHIFYKHICRGLCVNGSSYICGTNVLIKLDHLNEIGGMDESCITEDIATSFIFHSNGYKSIYIDKVYAEGLAPPSLSAYYGQQMRWSYGTFQNTKKVLHKFIKEPKSLKSLQWWEYIILNGSWYFIGVGIFIWLLYPIIVLLFNMKPLVLGYLNVPFYLFLIMIMSQTFTSFRERRYPLKELILAQGLFFSLFPVYTKAFIYGLVNKKLEFKVTPKKEVYKIQLKEILPQLTVIFLLIIAIIVGTFKVINGVNTITYPSIIFWAGYSLIMLIIFLLYFYREDKNKYNG